MIKYLWKKYAGFEVEVQNSKPILLTLFIQKLWKKHCNFLGAFPVYIMEDNKTRFLAHLNDESHMYVCVVLFERISQ